MGRLKTNYLILGATLLLSQACSKAIIDEDGGNTGPITEDVKYDPDVQNIMFNNCVTCHGGNAPSAGLLLNNYQDVKFSAENGKLIDRMNDATNPMPPSGLLPLETRKKLDKWASDGFPQN